MAIENGFIAECDGCDEIEIDYSDTIEEFIYKLENKGWLMRKLDSYEAPSCYCKNCH